MARGPMMQNGVNRQGLQRGVEARGSELGAAAAVGLALFLLRPFAAATPRAATLLLGVIWAGIAAVSLAPGLMPGRRRISPPAAALLGAAAVTAVRLASSPVVLPDRRAVAIVFGLAAAVAEEAYYRRLLYGAFEKAGGAFAVVATAAVFAAMHYPAYGAAALPVDFGAGLLFGWQRWASGSWLVPASTHVLANLLVSV